MPFKLRLTFALAALSLAIAWTAVAQAGLVAGPSTPGDKPSSGRQAAGSPLPPSPADSLHAVTNRTGSPLPPSPADSLDAVTNRTGSPVPLSPADSLDAVTNRTGSPVPLSPADSLDAVTDGLQQGTMCESDSVVWVAVNAGRVLHISSVRNFLTAEPACRYPCGGLCPGADIEKALLMGPYPTGGAARAALCAVLGEYGRSPISSPCPYWVKIGGQVYSMTSSPSTFCDWSGPTPDPPVPVPTGSSGGPGCVPVPPTLTPILPTPTATPEKVQLKGEVYAIPEIDQRMPLRDVPVILEQAGREVARVVTQGSDATFDFGEIEREDDYVVRVELRNVANGEPGIFRIAHGARPGAGGVLVFAETAPFSTRTESTPLERRIIFDPDFNIPPLVPAAGVPRARLDDLGAMYFHMYQAWELADSVTQVLDFGPPIDIVAYSANAGVYWFDDAGGPHINIDVPSSAYTDDGRPDNREWHEFGHHVMADAFSDRMPEDPAPCPAAGTKWADCNHMGAFNVSTTDSWTEGFAEFYSMMVAREIVGEPRPELYRYGGTVANLEANYLSFLTSDEHGLPPDEEFAVAGLLLDLVDPVNQRDSTPLGGSTYADCVSISFSNQLWHLATLDWGDLGRSPVAPDGYGHIFDMKQLYDVLKREGVGARSSRGRLLSDLDELFVAHGFWDDANFNGRPDPGEEIGRASYPRHPTRRQVPPVEGSYVAYEAVDAATGASVAVGRFEVDVRFAPPYEHLDFAYKTPAESPDRLYIHAPPSVYEAEMLITARGADSVSAAPLAIENRRYHELMATAPQDFVLTHTFEMVPAPRVFLPWLESPGPSTTSRGSAIVGSAARFGAPNQPEPTAFPVEACRPEEPGPSPTPPPTSTPGGIPIVDEVRPASVAVGESVEVTVFGAAFRAGAVVVIGPRALSDVELLPPESEAPHRQRLRGVLQAGLATGRYDVVVVNPGGAAGSLPRAFEVLDPAAATATAAAGTTATPSPSPTSRQATPTTETPEGTPGTGTPTATATFTPTPTPTPTPTNAVWLGRLFTSDTDNRWQSGFASLSEIKLWLQIPNTTGAPAEVEATWRVVGPGGFVPPEFDHTEVVTVDPERPNWTLTRTFPTDLPVGEYTFEGQVTWGGLTFADEILFYVGHGLELAYDFESGAQGWSTGPLESGELVAADGTYDIRLHQPDRVIWATRDESRTEQFVWEASVRQSEGDEGNHGLLVGRSDDGSRYTTFRLDRRGRWAVHRIDRSDGDADWETLAPWTEHAAIARDGLNHVMAVRRGQELTFYANGRRLGVVTDSDLPDTGRQGLIGGSLDDVPVAHRFDDVRLHRIVRGLP